MSQSGLIDIEGSHPQIPTQFNADSGSAIPINNQLEIIGATVANPNAQGKPVYTSASDMTVVTNVQVGTDRTGAPANKNDAGLVSFDDTQFNVDSNGYVTLIGGGGAVDSFQVDAFTAPGTNPVAPTAAGLVTVTGAQVASGTVGTNVIRTDSLAANTYTIEIQRATSAASPTLAANGVSHFDSDIFTVDSSGFVSLVGGDPAILKVNLQTGTTPIVPTSGAITLNGAVVAAGTNPVRTDGTGANTGAIEVQISQALAAEDATKIGLSNFDSGDFTVSAAGFVSLAGGGAAQTLTPDHDFDADTATPISPTGGNINVISYNPSPTNTFANFVTGTLNSTGAATGNLQIENRAWNTQFVVDSSTTLGSRGTYSTMASAMSAASAGDTVFLRSAITEDFTIKANVNIVGWPVSGSNSSPSITGKITMSTAGICTISGIKLITNSDYFLVTSGAVSASVTLDKCNLQCTNFTGINQTATSGAVRIQNCQSDLGTTGIALFASTAGTLQINNCPVMANTGGSTTASTKSAGTLFMQWSAFGHPITTSGTAAIQIQQCYLTVTNTTCLTHGGSGGTSFIVDSLIESGTATAISVGASGVLYCHHNDIASSNTNAIDGTGSILYGANTFSSSSSHVSTTTKTILSEGPSRTIGSSNSGATNTLTVTNASNTASSNANIVATVGGTSAGDATHQAVVSGTQTWTWGVDNSETGDPWVLAASATLGTTNALSITTAGVVSLAAGGSIVYNTSAGAIGSVGTNQIQIYEEGTYTPTIVGGTTAGVGTYGFQVGRYQRIGNRVHLTAYTTWSAHTGTGGMRIGGIPYTSANVSNLFQCFSVWASSLTYGANVQLTLYIGSNVSQGLFQTFADGAGSATPAIDTAGNFMYSGHYEV